MSLAFFGVTKPKPVKAPKAPKPIDPAIAAKKAEVAAKNQAVKAAMAKKKQALQAALAQKKAAVAAAALAKKVASRQTVMNAIKAKDPKQYQKLIDQYGKASDNLSNSCQKQQDALDNALQKQSDAHDTKSQAYSDACDKKQNALDIQFVQGIYAGETVSAETAFGGDNAGQVLIPTSIPTPPAAPLALVDGQIIGPDGITVEAPVGSKSYKKILADKSLDQQCIQDSCIQDENSIDVDCANSFCSLSSGLSGLGGMMFRGLGIFGLSGNKPPTEAQLPVLIAMCALVNKYHPSPCNGVDSDNYLNGQRFRDAMLKFMLLNRNKLPQSDGPEPTVNGKTMRTLFSEALQGGAGQDTDNRGELCDDYYALWSYFKDQCGKFQIYLNALNAYKLGLAVEGKLLSMASTIGDLVGPIVQKVVPNIPKNLTYEDLATAVNNINKISKQAAAVKSAAQSAAAYIASMGGGPARPTTRPKPVKPLPPPTYDVPVSALTLCPDGSMDSDCTDHQTYDCGNGLVIYGYKAGNYPETGGDPCPRLPAPPPPKPVTGIATSYVPTQPITATGPDTGPISVTYPGTIVSPGAPAYTPATPAPVTGSFPCYNSNGLLVSYTAIEGNCPTGTGSTFKPGNTPTAPPAPPKVCWASRPVRVQDSRCGIDPTTGQFDFCYIDEMVQVDCPPDGGTAGISSSPGLSGLAVFGAAKTRGVDKNTVKKLTIYAGQFFTLLRRFITTKDPRTTKQFKALETQAKTAILGRGILPDFLQAAVTENDQDVLSVNGEVDPISFAAYVVMREEVPDFLLDRGCDGSSWYMCEPLSTLSPQSRNLISLALTWLGQQRHAPQSENPFQPPVVTRPSVPVTTPTPIIQPLPVTPVAISNPLPVGIPVAATPIPANPVSVGLRGFNSMDTDDIAFLDVREDDTLSGFGAALETGALAVGNQIYSTLTPSRAQQPQPQTQDDKSIWYIGGAALLAGALLAVIASRR